MDSPLLSQLPSDSREGEPDSRDKKKYYSADASQRRMLIALTRALPRKMRGVYTEFPIRFEEK